MRKAAAKNNPKLAAAISNVDSSKLKFYATDGTRAGGVYSNVNVQVTAGAPQGLTTADVRDQLSQGYKSVGATLRDVKAVKVGNRSAFRTDAGLAFKNSDGTVTTEAQGQLLILGASSSTVVTATSTDDVTGGALINSILANVHHI